MAQKENRQLMVSPSPHVSKALSTRAVMFDVIIALVPAMLAAGYYFRLYAAGLLVTCVLSCVAAEWLWNRFAQRPNSLSDLSAVVTGIILAMSLPPELPLWAAAIGSAFAIIIGKMVFGGLGSNVFNPAMVGRTFMAASLGVLMTTWTVPATVDPELPKVEQANITDARTQATPLAWSKMAVKNELGADTYNKQNFKYTLTGEIGGSLGETSAIALMIGGAFLLIRRTINWRVPAGMLGAVLIFAGIAYMIDNYAYVQPLFHLTSGAMLLGAFFIATDPVTMPLTKKGMWTFGIGVGVLTMLIRVVGEYPEGLMYAILIMNAVTPLIDRYFKLVPAGGKPGAK